MIGQQDREKELSLAIRQFAKSVNSNNLLVVNMSALIIATSNLSLANLDFWERFIGWEFSEAMQISTSSKWKIWYKPNVFPTWLDLCSRDGFKREKTLRALAGAAPNQFFFAVALRRLNDWVPQVRVAAREKILIIAKNTDPEIIVDVLLATFSHWNSWGRMENKDKELVLEITAFEKVKNLLKSRIMSATSGPMVSVLSQVSRIHILDPYLNEIASKAIQPSVRAKAYRCLLEEKMTWCTGRMWEWTDKRYCKGHYKPIFCSRDIVITSTFLENLKSAVMDKSPIVRRVAAEMLIRNFAKIGDESVKLAELLASDSSPSVAERGKFALKSV